MTMITMAAQKNIIDILPFMAYLSAMSAQILVYCYSGSELLQSVSVTSTKLEGMEPIEKSLSVGKFDKEQLFFQFSRFRCENIKFASIFHEEVGILIFWRIWFNFFYFRVTNLIQVKAGTLFQFTLSLDTFMAVNF